jgi:hypothetical protein
MCCQKEPRQRRESLLLLFFGKEGLLPFWQAMALGLKQSINTPDGRYLVVRGRLWRRANPSLTAGEHARLVSELMSARRGKQAAMRVGDEAAREAARSRVDAAKVSLGERGPVWWTDGAPDLNRHLVKNSPYAAWFEGLART